MARKRLKPATSTSMSDGLGESMTDQLGTIAAQAEQKAAEQQHITSVIEAANALSADQRAEVLIQLRQEGLHNRPTTTEELWNYIRLVHGVEIPYTACFDYSCAPLEWLATTYFGWRSRTLGMAARGGAKTYGGAILHHTWGTFFPGSIGRHAAATREQAKVASHYLDMFARDPVLGEVFAANEVNKQDVRWKNSSHWAIVTGTISGVSGQHPSRATWDEIEFWDWDAIEQTWAVPVTAGEAYKVWAAFSTRQRSYGSMNRLVDEADSKGVALYTWTAFETMQRCTSCVAIDRHPNGNDSQRQSVCNLWEDCHGKAGTKSTGWIPRKDVCELKQSMSRKSWETQGLCLRPSSSGLVLRNFEHQQKPNGNYWRWRYLADWPWEAWYDPAEGKCSTIQFVQHDWTTGETFVFDELVIDDCPDASAMKQAFFEMCLVRGYPDPEYVVCDPHRTDAGKTWARGSVMGEGIDHAYNVVHPSLRNNDGGQEITITLEVLLSQICDGSGVRRLFINDAMCPRTIRAVKEYHYPSNMQGEITSANPAKEESDKIDPMRYGMMYKAQRIKSSGVRIRAI